MNIRTCNTLMRNVGVLPASQFLHHCSYFMYHVTTMNKSMFKRGLILERCSKMKLLVDKTSPRGGYNS